MNNVLSSRNEWMQQCTVSGKMDTQRIGACKSFIDNCQMVTHQKQSKIKLSLQV